MENKQEKSPWDKEIMDDIREETMDELIKEGEPKIEDKKTLELMDSEWEDVLGGLGMALSEAHPGSNPSDRKIERLIEKIEKMLDK